jgi:hypothetical protein
MYVQVKGPESAMESVFDRMEELVLTCLSSLDEKRQWMHDIAADNPDYYHERKGLVYQREPTIHTSSETLLYPWKWMCVLPGGDPSFAIPVIAGLTACLVCVLRTKEECSIYISGTDWHDEVQSDRALDRVR